MPFCNLRVALLVFVVLIGCDNPSNSQSKANSLPLVSVQQTDGYAGAVTYHWDHHGKDSPCLIPLPNRTTLPVALRFRQMDVDGSPVGVIFMDSEYAIEVGKILSDQVMLFVRPGEVVPYHDQLYLITFDNISLVIKRVTESVPAHYRPSPQHLVISRSESPEIREQLFLQGRDFWADYERVRIIHIAEDASHAEYEGKPYYGSTQGALGDKTIEHDEVVHQWANSTTKVARIVPPVEIEGVGRLRGWVEFHQTLSDN